MGGKMMKNEGLGLFKAKKKNSRKWLEGYYARASEMAGDGKPAIHFVVRRIGKTKPPVILGVSKKSFSNRITLLCLL